MNGKKLSYGAGVLVLLAAALIYLLTLDTGLRPDELAGGDLITHQYAQVEGRPGNAPGYPLYTMGGWLWFRLGRMLLGRVLNPVQILSLYSTLWALASLWVLYLILLRVTRGQWPVAVLLALFYATTFFFWYYSVTTEQYTSAVFQTLLVIWLAFKWDDQPGDAPLLWMAFITGTMLANMVTTLFIALPLLWFIFSRRLPAGRHGKAEYALAVYLKRPRLAAQAIGLAVAPVFSYIYVYLSGARHPEWRGQGQWATAWEWFIQFLTIRQGRDELAPGLSLQHIFTREFPALIWQELTWPVLLVGLVGLALLGRRRAIFLTGTLLVYLLFSWGYRFGNWFQVIIPAYPILIIGFAAGVSRGSKWIQRQTATAGHPRLNIAVQAAVLLLLAGLAGYRLWASMPAANQRYRPDDTGLDPGRLILADRPETPAVISGVFEERVALQYLTTVWGTATNIYPTGPGQFDPRPGPVDPPAAIYITRQAAAAAPQVFHSPKFYPQAAGVQLIALRPSPQTQLPDTAIPLNLNFGDNLQLAGWEAIAPAGPASRPNWVVALYWQATAPPGRDYTVSVRPLVNGQLITAGGRPVIQDHQPVWGVYPTSRWRPGEIVRDVYALLLPPLPARPQAMQVVVYLSSDGGFENLAEHTIFLDGDSP